MNDMAFLVEDNEYGESETATVVQALHQGCCLLLLRLTARLSGIVVHVDILEVLVDDLTNRGVVGDEVGKLQAPRAPVATDLTDDELVGRLGFRHSLVYLLQWVNSLVVDLLQPRLGASLQGENDGIQ